jgi:D-alanine-D-alanine ligase
MKITIITHLQSEGARQHDVVVDQISAALKKLGHTPSILGVHGDLGKLISGLRRRRPELIFNLMETFGSNELGSVAVVGLLDLLGVAYTGGGPGEFYLQEDKALTKKLLAFDRIDFPDFAVFSQDADLETGGNLRMPLFVKPLRMDASIGIDGHSLVRTAREMMERVVLIHEQVHDAALVEEYIDGREFYVGILGNQDAIAFPPIEMDFAGMPEGTPHILDSKAKWDEDSPEYKGSTAILPTLPDELKARLQKVALDAARALRVRDYGRIDMRLTDTGDIYVIEVNASCYLEASSEFARAAEAVGMDYLTLIGRIVDAALNRRETQSPHQRKENGVRTKASAKGSTR